MWSSHLPLPSTVGECKHASQDKSFLRFAATFSLSLEVLLANFMSSTQSSRCLGDMDSDTCRSMKGVRHLAVINLESELNRPSTRNGFSIVRDTAFNATGTVRPTSPRGKARPNYGHISTPMGLPDSKLHPKSSQDIALPCFALLGLA